MKIATIIARSLLGVIFVVFGSNMFLHFIPMPPPPEGPARDFMTALFVSHQLYVIGALQLAGGLLLLAGRWAPLGLTLLGPIIVNILAFHVFMSPGGLGNGHCGLGAGAFPGLALSRKLRRTCAAAATCAA
jgi:putative oxidoreductase